MQEVSYWIATAGEVPRFSHALPSSVDAVVVGGGVAGLSTALHFVEAGKRVVVLERGRVGQGDTSRSTGMVVLEPGSDYADLVAKYGLTFGRRVFDALTYGLDLLQDVVKEKSLSCEWQSVNALAVGSQVASVRQAHQEFLMLRSLGARTSWVDREMMKDRYPFLHARSGVVSEGHAVVNPYRLCLELARVVEERGGVVCEETLYTGHVRQGGQIQVETSRGMIQTNQLFLCSDRDMGMWLGDSVPLCDVEETVIVTEPVPILKGWEKRELIWNTFPLFEYARYLPDHRIMFGSGRSGMLAGQGTLRDTIGIMRRAFEETFAMPSLKIDYAWRGAFTITANELPSVGEVEPGVFVAGGYNGHGLVLGCLAGHLLSRMASGQPHPYEDLFGVSECRGRTQGGFGRPVPRLFRQAAMRWRFDRLNAEDARMRRS